MDLNVKVVTKAGSSKKVTSALLALIEKYGKEYPINIQKTNEYN